MMDLSRAHISAILRSNTEIDEWYPLLLLDLPKFDITTPKRIAAFLAQCGHESGNFKILGENLNYSAARLVAVWPRQFPTVDSAKPYERNPEKLANKIYSGRMGNGDEASGDGWKFRGRGLIQLTGKDNYTRCSQGLYKDDTLLKDPDYLKTKEGAVLSACWFWQTNGLNELADDERIVDMTKRINGGTHGLEDREKKYNTALAVLNNTTV